MPAPRKPHNLHVIDGTARKDRHGNGPLPVMPIDPTPRAGMAPELLDAWHEVIEGGREFLAQSDRIAVELAAMLITKARSGATTAAELAQLTGLLGKLGLTPPGRRGLDPVRTPAKADNPFEKFRMRLPTDPQ